jgi:ABC-2 type transport system ATP-binding protein
MIEANGLTKHYKDFVALEKLSLTIGAGEIFGYIGPNGAGKSTTIKLFCGLIRPTSGTGTICGLDIIKDAKKIKSVVGYMPDNFGVYEEIRVWEYLDFFGAAYKIKRKERQRRIDEIMELAGITHMKDFYVDALSKGMKQKVGLAKTLIHNPQVLFLDEPMSGLDPRARIEMRTLLKELRAQGKTILISSHILPELADISDTIGIIEHGHLLASGTVAEVLASIKQVRQIDIHIHGDTQRAIAVLEALREKDLLQKITPFENTIQIETQADDIAIAAILRTLITNTIPIIWFKEVESDLEEVFMSVTAQKAKEKSAEGANE